jgi:hypothetical protein
MKNLFLFTVMLFIFQLSHSQCKMDFSNLSNVCYETSNNQKNYVFIAGSHDTIFIKDMYYISLHKVKCDSKKIGIWPFNSTVIVTDDSCRMCAPTISLEKTERGTYLIEPIKFISFHKYPAALVIKDIMEIAFFFEDKSFFKILPNGNGEYVFISSGQGSAANFGKFFY